MFGALSRVAPVPPVCRCLGVKSPFESLATERYLTMGDRARVRVLEFVSAVEPAAGTLLLVPGCATVFPSWEPAVRLLTHRFRVLYFESREKASSQMPDRRTERGITLHRMAQDLGELSAQLDLAPGGWHLLASSTGSTTALEALSLGWLKPAGAILVGAMPTQRVSRLAAFFTGCTPTPLKRFSLVFYRLYLRWVYADPRRHPTQYAKYARAADEVELPKIRPLLKEMSRHNCLPMAPQVTVPCLVVGASSDGMHTLVESRRLCQALPDGRFVDLGSNDAAHGQPLVEAMEAFVREHPSASPAAPRIPPA